MGISNGGVSNGSSSGMISGSSSGVTGAPGTSSGKTSGCGCLPGEGISSGCMAGFFFGMIGCFVGSFKHRTITCSFNRLVIQNNAIARVLTMSSITEPPDDGHQQPLNSVLILHLTKQRIINNTLPFIATRSGAVEKRPLLFWVIYFPYYLPRNQAMTTVIFFAYGRHTNECICNGKLLWAIKF